MSRSSRLMLCVLLGALPLLIACGVIPSSSSSSSGSTGGSATFVYVADAVQTGLPCCVNPQFTGAGGISEFQMAANGALTPVAGSPLAFSSSMPMSLAADPLGRLIFGASATDIYTFSINASTGALTQVAMIAPLPPVAYSAHTNSSSANDFAGPMVVDHAGSFLYALTMCAADGGVNTISPYLGYPLPDVVPVPPAITLSPGGGFLLVSQTTSDFTLSFTGSVVSVFAVDTNTGNLTAVPGSPFTLGVANATPNGSPNSTVAVNVTQP